MNNLGFHCHDLDILEEITTGNGLCRSELYNLHPDEPPRLKRLVERHKLMWSIHAPLVQLDWYPQPPTWSFLCDDDRDNRELTMKMVRLTVEHAEEFGAEYIVVHMPSPASDDSTESEGKVRDIAWRSCERLAELSFKRKMPIHIEGVGASPLIDSEFLCPVLKEFSPLRYCLDTAHTYLAALQNSFDIIEFEKELLPYLGSMHLWNIRSKEDYLAFRHIPIHPSQHPEDGWIDIARLLQSLGSNGNSIPIIFESERSYPKELGGYDYREGVEWAKKLLGTLS